MREATTRPHIRALPEGVFRLSAFRSRRFGTVVAAGALAAGALIAQPAAQAFAADQPSTANASAFVSYASFIKDTAAAQYPRVHAASGTTMKADAQAFNQMQTYILNHYRGVTAKHSYLLDGAYFDCVVTGTQPSVRDLGIAHVAAPPPAHSAALSAGQHAVSQVTPGLKDAFGNAVACPAGTIPMRRMTLQETVKFPSLAAYLGKEPAGAPSPTVAPGVVTPGGPHRYGVGYQSVANRGINSWLNLWNPSGDFTLSQLWDVSSASTTQTLESGWVHYPAKFGSNSVLFIYWTPNNYATGCYNLDCSGFVQTSSVATLGAGFSNYSTDGGTQYGFGLQYQWYQGNWWLYFQNSALGYYPGGIYNGGPLSSGNANLVEYGGETYTAGSTWPQMGSGQFASAGWTHAAFQNTIFYVDTNGAGQLSSLSPIVTNPGCYTLSIVPASQGGSWGSYIWFGGPGGNC